MPKVPIYNPNQVREQTAPVVNVNHGMFGANIFDSMQQGDAFYALQKGLNAIRSEQLRQDKDFAREALNNSQFEINKFFTDAQTRNPKDNLNVDFELDNLLKKQYDNATKGLTNQQKELFNPSYSAYANDYKAKAYQIKADAKNKFEVSTIAGQNDLTFKDYYAGIIPYEKMRETIDPNLSYLTRNMALEEKKSFIQEYYTKLHTQYAEGLALKDPVTAKNYIEKYKTDMNPMIVDELNKKFDTQYRHMISEASKAPTDPQLVMKLNMMSAEELEKEDLTKYKNKLNGKDYKYYTELQNKLKANPDLRVEHSQIARVEGEFNKKFKGAKVYDAPRSWSNWIVNEMDNQTNQNIDLEKQSLISWLKEKPRTQDEFEAKLTEAKNRLSKPIYVADFNAKINSIVTPQKEAELKAHTRDIQRNAILQFMVFRGIDLNKYKKVKKNEQQ